MFSNQANSLDLFFSNPAEHFLGPENGNRLSLESGFGSNHSFHPSSNSKELSQFSNTNSQDLLSQTQKTDLDSEICNSNYQKYISQSRIFGNAGKMQIKHSSSAEKSTFNKVVTDFHAELDQEDIKNYLRTTVEITRKLSDDLKDVQHTMKELAENSSVADSSSHHIENTIKVQFNKLEEDFKSLKTITAVPKTMKELYDLSLENKENITHFTSSLENYIEINKNEITKHTKEYFKIQENNLKKLLHQINEQNKYIRKIEILIQKINEEFEKSLYKKWMNYEAMIEKKFNDQNAYLKESFEDLKNIIYSENLSRRKTHAICDSNEKNDSFKVPNQVSQNGYGAEISRNPILRYNPLPLTTSIKTPLFQNNSFNERMLNTTPRNTYERITPIQKSIYKSPCPVSSKSTANRKSNRSEDKNLGKMPQNYKSKLRNNSCKSMKSPLPVKTQSVSREGISCFSKTSVPNNISKNINFLNSHNRNVTSITRNSTSLNRNAACILNEDKSSFMSSPCLTIQEVVSCSKNIYFRNSAQTTQVHKPNNIERQNLSRTFWYNNQQR